MLPRLTGFFHDCFAWVVTSLPVFFLWVAPGGFPQEPLNVNGRLSLMTPMTTSMIMMLSVITMMSVPAGRPEVSLLPPPFSLSLSLPQREDPQHLRNKKTYEKTCVITGFWVFFHSLYETAAPIESWCCRGKKKDCDRVIPSSYWVLPGFIRFHWAFLHCIRFYWVWLVFHGFSLGFPRVSLGFTEFYGILLVFHGFSLGFTRFYWVFMGVHWVLLGFTGFDRFFMGYHWVLLGFTGSYWGFTGFYWVFTGFYWVFLGFTGFYWFFMGFHWVLLGFTVFDRFFMGYHWVLLGFGGF